MKNSTAKKLKQVPERTTLYGCCDLKTGLATQIDRHRHWFNSTLSPGILGLTAQIMVFVDSHYQQNYSSGLCSR